MSTTHTSATTFFVIAKQDTRDLVTTAFDAGRNADSNAVLVFSTETKAQAYLQNAEWLQSETVAELQSVDFIRWLLDCRDNGVTLAAVDPDRIQQQDGIRQTVISIDNLFASLEPAIVAALNATDYEGTP
ncbi:MAG: hypothetical protein R3C59_15050 [Planctomycetaceae bacterium]